MVGRRGSAHELEILFPHSLDLRDEVLILAHDPFFDLSLVAFLQELRRELGSAGAGEDVAYSTGDVEVRLVANRALEHASVLLNEVIVDSHPSRAGRLVKLKRLHDGRGQLPPSP